MKIALITDTHFGCHGNDEKFLSYQESFFNDIFFPYLEKNKIKTIFDLGDTFDSRKSISYFTLHESKRFLFNRIEDEGYTMKIIVGNHSMLYKHQIDVNSPKLLFDKYRNIEVIEESVEFTYDGIKFLFVPWISNLNQETILKSINDTDAKYLLGHFEIAGMKLHKGWQFHKGLDHSLLNKFKCVWSGHYHIKLKKDNFMYLGTPYQLDKSDLYQEKGFHVFDTETKKMEFIKNPNAIYHIVEYSEDVDIDSFDYKKYEKSFITTVLDKTIEDYNKFDLFLKRIDDVSYDCVVDERFYNNIIEVDAEETMEEIESTLDTIKRKVNEIDVVDNKKLYDFLEKAYNISVNLK